MINKKYLTKETLNSSVAYFAKHKHIQFLDFLNNTTLQKIKIPSTTKHIVPDKFSYSSAQLPSSLNFMTSKEFCSFVSFIAQQQLNIKDAAIKSFEHRDYTLLYDDLHQDDILVIFELTKQWKEEWGGYTSFIDDGECFRVVPQKNNLLIVNHQNLKHFVKYVNHHAKSKRIFVEMWFE